VGLSMFCNLSLSYCRSLTTNAAQLPSSLFSVMTVVRLSIDNLVTTNRLKDRSVFYIHVAKASCSLTVNFAIS
jgi:hypothetical protein